MAGGNYSAGRVTIGGKLVNAEMVRAGLAWRYTTYDKRNEFGGLEADARRQRSGLWADAAPIAPWEWRKTEKDRKAAKRAKSTRQSENRVTF